VSAETAVGSSPTMESLSERRFEASAVISISRTFTFMTSGTSRLFEAGFSIEQA
jgi:hypothetical protein